MTDETTPSPKDSPSLFKDQSKAPAMTPCDWDHQSRCWEDDCTNPATHRRLTGMADDTPVYTLVCCGHASSGTTSQPERQQP